jgi:solute carrier family 29 (equilibrative nucleoside transporter), member 1/2/3
MFLAAAPYFQERFLYNPWISRHFQPGITSVSTLTELFSMLILAKLQNNTSYTRRVGGAFTIHTTVCVILAISITLFRSISVELYFGFLLIVATFASMATSLGVNGTFAFASSFRRTEYTHALMVGQAVSGIMPAMSGMFATINGGMIY